jgi:hypothetical protein
MDFSSARPPERIYRKRNAVGRIDLLDIQMLHGCFILMIQPERAKSIQLCVEFESKFIGW